jgi:hypothetical protein
MTTLREAAQQALEALEGWKDDAPSQWNTKDEKLITALRAALTEEALQRLTDANQEIESMIVDEGCFERGCACHDSRESPGVVVVKREWRGLTEEDMIDTQDRCGVTILRDEFLAIEAALKERNHE